MNKPFSILLLSAILVTGVLLSGCNGQSAAPDAVPASSQQSAPLPSSEPSGDEAASESGASDSSGQDAPSGASSGADAGAPSGTEGIPGGYPVGKMFVTKERLAYRDGDLILRVPRFGLETKVVGGFSAEVQEKLQNGTMTQQERIDFFGNSEGDLLLKTGVVLLNSSSLPDPVIPNPNVSISGHRDIEGSEFYDIHKLTVGDRIYLTFGGREYVYEWQSTTIHQANDWSITYSGSDSIVSLISCDPIGTNRNRIVAVGKLVGYRDVSADSSEAPAAGNVAAI